MLVTQQARQNPGSGSGRHVTHTNLTTTHIVPSSLFTVQLSPSRRAEEGEEGEEE